jgi:uncharacterized protein (TIGR02270 family)
MAAIKERHPVNFAVLSQHVDDAACLRSTRSVLVRAPHVRLKDLARADERIAAHLDGVSIVGEHGASLCRTALDVPGVGELFVSCVVAIERRDGEQLRRLLSMLDCVPVAPRALSSAFGWVSAFKLREVVARLLASESPQMQWAGLVACAQHRVDPGAPLARALHHEDVRLRARALRAAGELGRIDLLGECLAHLNDDVPGAAFAAARSAVLLGERTQSLTVLREMTLETTSCQLDALIIALFASKPPAARALVKDLADHGADGRTMIRAAGWSGNPHVVPWLLDQMEAPARARLAGEAFSFITGVDLAWLDLHQDAPDDYDSPGPNDDPADANVALDEDEDLRWPDVVKVRKWWKDNKERFDLGMRYLAGTPPTAAHCLDVLERSVQRQRIAAALYLCMLKPASVMFNCAAPSTRQARLLRQLAFR